MIIISRQTHPYHLVDISPWPILMSLSILSLAISIISWITDIKINIIPSLIIVIFLFIIWWRDVIRESKAGYHNKKVQKGLLIGFILF